MFLEQVTIQEIPELQVPSSGASLSTVFWAFLEQVVDVPVRDIAHPVVSRRNVERMVDVPVAVPLVLDQLVPQERAQQRSVEQVVHAHVPPAPGFARVPQHETPTCSRCSCLAGRSAGAIRREGFRTFPRPQKSANVISQSSADLGAQSSSSTSSAAIGWTTTMMLGRCWRRRKARFWLNLRTRRSQWHPPWER